MRKSPRTFPTWSKQARPVGILQESTGGDGSAPAEQVSSPAGRVPSGASAATADGPSPGVARDGARSDLQRRRDALAEQVTELHWDLGGLAYEMAIRDHFRLDVLVRRAAVLQERDAELAETERLLSSSLDAELAALHPEREDSATGLQ